ncbi:Arm DNA-binding domain-containing protein [Pseudomonas sp. KCJK9111]|uniref:Arm DNA-binding domain-containing protein n=1 Tax=Pseudomonas sp. KCJK9111 TaxID=3344555 RepID=UPI00390612CB
MTQRERAGGKSWHFRYSRAGKQKRIPVGIYPEVGLRQARLLRDEARRLIAQGTNPCTYRWHQRHPQNLAEQNIFQAMYALWL